ncbi:chitin synthase chs-2-like [Bactrocera oleae]|uniref:chitin synthase chs-2-like n=1 Tax=Bactrocera oleae TaxID=104688 RepID=UPI00387EDB4B
MFNEFYNQRRRWVPSTIANIFDLLSDADMVVQNNSSNSTPYIVYQAMLMVGTILGPGTIFLMMVGALVAVFSTSIWSSFLWNFVPVFCFILSCIYLKQKFQIKNIWELMAVLMMMMAVLIGIIIQMIDDGPPAPASLLFLLVFMQIFIAGIVHPQEVGALICGFIYYITIPSMYMLLLIYSVFNMNDVSWGTREVTVKKISDEDAAQEIRGNAVNIARQLQRPKRFDDDDENSSDGEDNLYTDARADKNNSMVRRHTIFKLHESRNKTQLDYSDLPRNFELRFLGEDELKVKHISMSRKSLIILNEKRCVAKRRLTEQVKHNTDFNKNPLPCVRTDYTNAAFESPLI